MKKLLFVFLALAGVAFAAEAGEMFKSYTVMAAAISLGIAAFGAALGMGNTASATITGMARNPGVGGKIMTTMFIAIAMIEAQVIYTLVVGLILLYANPLL